MSEPAASPILFVVPGAEGRVWIAIRSGQDAAGQERWFLFGLLPHVAMETVRQLIDAVLIVRKQGALDLTELAAGDDTLPLEGIVKETIH